VRAHHAHLQTTARLTESRRRLRFGARFQADTALAEFLHEVKSASFVDYRRLTQILVRALVRKPLRTCVRA